MHLWWWWLWLTSQWPQCSPQISGVPYYEASEVLRSKKLLWKIVYPATEIKTSSIFKILFSLIHVCFQEELRQRIRLHWRMHSYFRSILRVSNPILKIKNLAHSIGNVSMLSKLLWFWAVGNELFDVFGHKLSKIFSKSKRQNSTDNGLIAIPTM